MYGGAAVDNKDPRVRPMTSLVKFFGVSDPRGARSEGLADFLDELRLAAGINPIFLVNDMETVGDWTESANGTFDVAVNTSGKQGTNAQKFTATAAGDGTQNVQTLIIRAGDAIPSGDKTGRVETVGDDWRDSDFVGFWAKPDAATDFNAAGDLKFNVRNGGTWGTAVNVPAVPAATVAWQRIEIDITSFQRDKVDAIRFELTSGPAAAEDVSIDQIIRYKFGNGYGPVWGGSVFPFPVKNAATPTLKQIATFETGAVGTTQTVLAATAAARGNLGPVVVSGTGNARYGEKQVWIQRGGFSYWPVGTTITGKTQMTCVWFTGHKLKNSAATTTQDRRVIARILEDTTVTEDVAVLVEWGFFAEK